MAPRYTPEYAREGTIMWDWTLRQYVPNPMTTGPDWFTDELFHRVPQRECNGLVLYPCYVSGYDSNDWFVGWPGIGPSPAQFSMKAFATADGERVFHGTGRGGPSVLVETHCPVPKANIRFISI